MVAELTALRDQIDDVDKALLKLLAKRLDLVAEVGEVKSHHGLPIYVPEREVSMLASRRNEAEALGVPPDLIEDVLRRIMRESYTSEHDKGFKTLCPSLRPVVTFDMWEEKEDVCPGTGVFATDKYSPVFYDILGSGREGLLTQRDWVDFDRLQHAVNAARSARFEFGESGPKK